MVKVLRPYQSEAIANILKGLKESTNPILVDASVGSGKSLICARVLLRMEQAGYKALCLTMNSTLIQQNAETYETEGGTCGIYVASINRKDTQQPVIFASPNSVCNGIRDNKNIAQCRFKLIIIDECHNINHNDSNSMYMRIIHHFGLLAQTHNYSYRIVGLSGTCFRGKGISIHGPNEFFKSLACSISTSWLISQGYLTKPVFGLPEAQGYDFSNIRVNSMGKFSGSELQAVIDSNARLTGSIMMELQEVMKTRRGAFIFAATRKHCEECLKSLPIEESAIITGETPHEERKQILERAKNGDIRYLINVNVLTVGIDVPSYDVCAWLRPTESLILYTQGIGRVLRLHPGKSNALILDYAGNLTRHGDIDDPIINEALQPKEENEKDYVIPCLTCGTNNTVHARRCIGIHDNKRCDHFFEWKDCPNCGVQNDKTSRECRGCNGELIDPNAKLVSKAAKPELQEFQVILGRYWLTEPNGHPQWNCMYQTKQGLNIYESFSIKDDRMKNIFYGIFIRHHVTDSSKYYPVLDSISHLRKLLESGDIKTPNSIGCIYENNRYRIRKRHFIGVPEHESTARDTA